MSKYIEYFKKLNKQAIINIVLVCGIIGYIGYTMDLKMPTMPTKIEVLKPKVLEVKPKVAECSPQEAKIVLSDSQLAKSMNLFVADLNGYEIREVKEVLSSVHKEALIGVNRALIPKTKGGTQVYLTIYETKDKLNYNKKDYETIGIFKKAD